MRIRRNFSGTAKSARRILQNGIRKKLPAAKRQKNAGGSMSPADSQKTGARAGGGSFLRAPRPPLSAELQTLDERVVAVKRRAFEIVEELSAAACHCDEPAARMEVLLICREVVGQVRNARRKYGHLNFAGTRVAFRDGEFLDYFLFVYRLVFGHFQSFVAARILGPSPEKPRPSAVPDRRLNSAHLGGVSRNAPQRPERFPARRSAAHSDAFFMLPHNPRAFKLFLSAPVKIIRELFQIRCPHRGSTTDAGFFRKPQTGGNKCALTPFCRRA